MKPTKKTTADVLKVYDTWLHSYLNADVATYDKYLDDAYHFIGSNGEMISGNIGSATLKRLDYTVIGDTVNTAARLQDAAKENQIVICESCYEKVKEAFQCKKLGSINMKNKAQPLTVYEVVA